jgi:hypothetical protein
LGDFPQGDALLGRPLEQLNGVSDRTPRAFPEGIPRRKLRAAAFAGSISTLFRLFRLPENNDVFGFRLRRAAGAAVYSGRFDAVDK